MNGIENQTAHEMSLPCLFGSALSISAALLLQTKSTCGILNGKSHGAKRRVARLSPRSLAHGDVKGMSLTLMSEREGKTLSIFTLGQNSVPTLTKF